MDSTTQSASAPAQLADKVAIVTGAASGIGKAIAQTLAAAGAQVAIVDTQIDTATAVADAIGRTGDRAFAEAVDVTDEDSVDGAFDRIAARAGGIDILIANAGIQIVHPLVDFPFAEWRKVMAVNLDGAFLCTRAALRHMMRDAKRGGVVIYTGSVHSHAASPLKAPYVAAKHGLLGLARVLAKEGAAHNVRSHVVCPGFVRTPLVDTQIPEQARALGISEADVVKKVMLAETVDGEFTTLAEVARTVLFLAAFPGNALTGQSLLISHGWQMI